MRQLLLLLLAAVIASACGADPGPWDQSASRPPAVILSLPRSCAREGRLFLVPIGEVRRIDLNEVIERYRQEYGLPIALAAPVAIGPRAMDGQRNQVVAEELAAAVSLVHGPRAGSDAALRIGVTDEDMFIRGSDWRFAFSARFEGMAIMSSARMDPVFFGQSEDAAALYARFYKILTKNVGVLHCGLPMSDNPRSVMYGAILSVEDLDTVDESVW